MNKSIRLSRGYVISYLVILVGALALLIVDRINNKEQRLQLKQFQTIAKSETLARLYSQQYYLEEILAKEQNKKKQFIWLDQLNQCRRELEKLKP